MATEARDKAPARRASTTTAERTAYKAGDKVEYDNQLAKVVNYGFLEIPTNPGENAKFSETLGLNLQLPAASPGGKPEYAFNVDPSDVKALKDDPKRLRSLEMESNALFGDPVPVEPSAEKQKGPEIRQKGAAPEASKTSSTRGKEGKATAAPRAAAPVSAAVDGKDGATFKTNKAGADTAPKAAKAKAPAAKKSSKKAVK